MKDTILSITIFGGGECYHSSLTKLDKEAPKFTKIDLIPGTNPILFLELLLIIYNEEGEGIRYVKKNIAGSEAVALKSINKEIEALAVHR